MNERYATLVHRVSATRASHSPARVRHRRDAALLPNYFGQTCIVFLCSLLYTYVFYLSDDFREIWVQNVNGCSNEFFWNRILKFFPKKESFSPWVLEVTLEARALQPWPLGLRRIWALHLLGEGPWMFVQEVTFFVRLTVFETRVQSHSPLISGTSRNVVRFPLPYSVGSLYTVSQKSSHLWTLCNFVKS